MSDKRHESTSKPLNRAAPKGEAVTQVRTKLPFREKFAYFCVNIGNIPIMTLANSLLSFYYTEVLGMNPIAVGTLFLAARVFDGIDDPLTGFVIDHLRDSKFGKFRKVLLVGVTLCSLNYLVLWIGPAHAGGLQMAVAYVSYLLLGVTFSIMDIALNSMLPVLTSDLNERSKLSSVKVAGYGVGALACGVVAPKLISVFGGGVRAYEIVISIFVGIVLLFSVGGALGIRQRLTFENRENYHVKDLLRILAQKPLLVTFGASLVYGTGCAFATTTNPYYAEHVLGKMDLMVWFTLSMAAGMIPVVFLAPPLTKRFGKKPVYGGGMILAGAGLLVRLIAPSSLPVVIVSCVLYGLGLAFCMVLFYGVQADNTDYIDFTMQKRSEGAVSATASMITKISNGLGGALPLYILGMTKTSAGTYSAAGLAISNAVLPAVLCLAGGLLFILKYPIKQSMLEEMRQIYEN